MRAPGRPGARWALVLGLAAALAGACRGGEAGRAESADPEARAVRFLSRHLFDEPAALADRFTPDVQPADFPLRLVVDRPDELRLIDIWRLRSVDGRIIVEALIELRGAPHVQTFWLSESAGVWRISGWEARPTPVTADAPTPSAGARIPRPFAGPLFRGGRSTPLLPVDPPPPAPEAPVARVEVAVQVYEYQGACAGRERFGQIITGLSDALVTCYTLDPPRGGRLTFSVTADGPAGRTLARLDESTLLDDDLSDCLRRTFEALPVAVGPDAVCTARTRVVLRPSAPP